MADVAAARQEWAPALAAYLESFEMFAAYPAHAATMLSGIAAVLARRGSVPEAARAVGILDRWLDRCGVSILPWAVPDDLEARRLVGDASRGGPAPADDPDDPDAATIMARVSALVGVSR